MKYLLRRGLLLLLVVVSACSSGTGSKTMPQRRPQGTGGSPRAWTDVTPAKLSSMLAAKDFFLVNVHVPYEGQLPKTDAFIPFDQIGSRLRELPGKADKIVLYCRSGRMSQLAVESLAAAGYSNLYQLQGGFNAWRAAGLPFIVGSVPAG